MPVAINIEIENLDALRANFNEAPALTLKYLSQAVSASVFELEKEAVDSNFQFKTPRGKRSGDLQKSFKYGREIKPLMGKIGPTVFYAPYVYFGTRRGIKPNYYIDRIANAAEDKINKHFEKAVNLITTDLAKT